MCGPSFSSPLPAGSAAARGGRPSPVDSPVFRELVQGPGWRTVLLLASSRRFSSSLRWSSVTGGLSSIP
ncbi:hypothetical protein pipiens_018493 [Culex pipiens pipiens]|uniref:Uncharacterized protein n=1 Tax=Culex pipiens pipiens TaxID=38569 RepID=A0ABD1CBF9_CULPP